MLDLLEGSGGDGCGRLAGTQTTLCSDATTRYGPPEPQKISGATTSTPCLERRTADAPSQTAQDSTPVLPVVRRVIVRLKNLPKDDVDLAAYEGYLGECVGMSDEEDKEDRAVRCPGWKVRLVHGDVVSVPLDCVDGSNLNASNTDRYKEDVLAHAKHCKRFEMWVVWLDAYIELLREKQGDFAKWDTDTFYSHVRKFENHLLEQSARPRMQAYAELEAFMPEAQRLAFAFRRYVSESTGQSDEETTEEKTEIQDEQLPEGISILGKLLLQEEE